MKQRNLFIAMLLFYTLPLPTHALDSKSPANENIRQPAVAGKFYSADSSRLAAAIRGFLETARPPGHNRPLAIIAPHAGYMFSGQIAADAYNQVKNYTYDLIVVIGVNHTTRGFSKISIYPKHGYKTPLGTAWIDDETVAQLHEADAVVTYDSRVHEQEHSVEVHIPFVQLLFPDAEIVPVVMGTADPDICQRFGEILATTVKNRKTLFIASSDLSHYPGHDEAVEVDRQTLASILKLDPLFFSTTLKSLVDQRVENLSTCACGEAAILTVMSAASRLGANCAAIVSYANSGQTALGSKDRVVGYGAVVITKTDDCRPGSELLFQKTPADNPEALSGDHKKRLLEFARQTIKRYFDSETTPLARDFPAALTHNQGAFVTLTKNGQMRGCIGDLAGETPLCQVVGAMALRAAFADRRFPPLELAELADVELEISVLTPVTPVANVEDIIPGQHGLLLTRGQHHGVLLPQVAAERNWDRYEFLDHLCLKAGLPVGSWNDGAQLYSFQSEVFHESEIK